MSTQRYAMYNTATGAIQYTGAMSPPVQLDRLVTRAGETAIPVADNVRSSTHKVDPGTGQVVPLTQAEIDANQIVVTPAPDRRAISKP